MSNLKQLSDTELLKEMQRRNLLTGAKFHHDVDLSRGVKVILTYGIPEGTSECSQCRQTYDTSEFGYYQTRVDKNGYRMRSNALCSSCRSDHGQELKKAIKLHKKSGKPMPVKPESGDVCNHCQRSWSGKWHLHHRHDKLIGYLCGHCNMSFSDHRNEQVNSERGRDYYDSF